MKKLIAVAFLLTIASLSAHAQVSCPGGAAHCVALTWTAPTSGGTPTTYNIYRGTGSGQCVSVHNTGCVLAGSVTAPTLTFTDTSSSLVGSTKYYYWITASNAAGEGPGGGGLGVSFTTSPDVPGAPGNLAVDPSQSQ